MNTVDLLPAKADISKLVKSLLPKEGYVLQHNGEPLFDKSFYPTAEEAANALEACDEANEFASVFDTLTIGWTAEKGSWSYQTGDNSYTGGAYGHPVWAVVYITFDSNPEAVSEDILNQLAEQID